MPCYHPLKAVKTPLGVKILNSNATLFNLLLPCGQCIGCRLERARQWALRCLHEARFHERSSFVTLTYNDENLPFDKSLDHRHFQLFMKRLRKKTGQKIRYYMAGEYGDLNRRPHYHAILFGYYPDDCKLFSTNEHGNPVYSSKSLDDIWQLGFTTVGEVNFMTAGYVARYCLKKITGDAADYHYRSVVNTETSEIHYLQPEYAKMSLKPGIGSQYFEKYISDIFPHDRVVYDGHEQKPPRYYDKKYKKINPDNFLQIKNKRMLDSRKKLADNTHTRLIVKETVKIAQINQLKRNSI